MKDFDINEAQKGAKVITRDGHNARVICYDRKGTAHSVAALVEFIDGADAYELIKTYNEFGIERIDGQTSEEDLMMLTDENDNYIYDK